MTQQNRTPLEKTNRALEIFWLLITVFAVGLAVYTIVTDGWEYGKWYIIFPLLAGAMYLFRRMLRKRYDKRRLQPDTQSKKKEKKHK